jgi:murein DD-endopeptidase MepM/ murein hydrolase activator NlpD
MFRLISIFKKSVLAGVLLSSSFLCKSQRIYNFRTDYCIPLDFPLLISGGYGDIRYSSFHFGIDYTTRGNKGYKVFSIDSGYVARIKIEPGGYGRAIYINHPGGLTSVYAHLDSFSAEIGKYVKSVQYANKSFYQDITVDSNLFRVKKCEIIGYSGNSGMSTGPHLHFEMRDTRTQHTLNSFILSFHARDTVPPSIKSLFLYDNFTFQTEMPLSALQISPKSNNLTFERHHDRVICTYYPSNTVEVPENFFAGISADDVIDYLKRNLNFYSVTLKIDTSLIYQVKFDEISFDETNLANGLIDFQRRVKTGQNILLLFKYPNFSPTPIKKVQSNGMITLKDTLIHRLSIEVSDITGNSSIMYLNIKKSIKYFNEKLKDTLNKDSRHLLLWNKQNMVHIGNLYVIFPHNCLYSNLSIAIALNRTKNFFPHYFLQVGSEAIPLKGPFIIKFPVGSYSSKYIEKLVVAKIVGKQNLVSIGGKVEDNYIVAKSRTMGDFTLAIDTLSPKIVAVNVKENADMSSARNIRVKITDNLSGIASYDGYIDGQWVLFEYDKKNDEISYTFDDKCPINGDFHQLKIVVRDNCNNRQSKIIKFKR